MTFQRFSTAYLEKIEEIKAYAEKLKFNDFYAKAVRKGILTARRIQAEVSKIPVDPFVYCARFKIPVIELDFSSFENLYLHNFDGFTIYKKFLRELIPEDYYTAFVKKYDNADYMVLIEKRLPVTRKRFVLAHELGHIYLGHFEVLKRFKDFTRYRLAVISEQDLFREVEFLRRKKDRIKAKQEIEANAFAGEFLVPTVSLKSVLFDLKVNNLKDLSSIFQVSASVIYIQAFLNGLADSLIMEPETSF